MKIGLVSSVGGPAESPIGDSIRNVDALTRRQVEKVKRPDTEIVFANPVSMAGIAPDEYTFLKAIGDVETLHGYMELAKTGAYDALVSWCFLDPMKREARQAVDIPAIGIAENAMYMACRMGKKFGIVAPNSEQGRITTDAYIQELGLRSRAVPTRKIPLASEWDALEDAHEGIAAFKEVSRALIADGAEVIIPGCVLVDVMAANVPECEDIYPDGLREVDGVPVLNVGALAVKMAETMAELKLAGLPWISRKGYYASMAGDPVLTEMQAETLTYHGQGFWLD